MGDAYMHGYCCKSINTGAHCLLCIIYKRKQNRYESQVGNNYVLYNAYAWRLFYMTRV